MSSPPASPPLLVATVVATLVALLCLGPSAAAEDDSIGTWPLSPDPPVVNRFDPPPTPYAAGHRGVDLGGSVGQGVRAAMAGTISFAGSIAGRGVVVVDHGPTRTTYEPVEAAVSVGDVVGQGARIGTLEGSGSHCWPAACLHWGWIRAETYLDPLLLVGAGPVRLLPLSSPPTVDRSVPAPGGVWSSAALPTPLEVWTSLRLGGVPGGRPSGVGRW